MSAAVDTTEFTVEVTEAVLRLAGVAERTPLQRERLDAAEHGSPVGDGVGRPAR